MGRLSIANNTTVNTVIRGTVVIVVVGIIAKFASFITEAVLAAYLGTTYESDAYYMVWSIHAVVYPMMSVGIWKVFLPLYKEHIAKQERELAYSLTNASLTFFTGISIIVVVLLITFAPFVVATVAPGFSGATKELCIKLVRISAPMYIFIIASAVYASILQCHNKFLGSQIREVVSHIPTIIGIVFFYRRFGIEAMAIALVLAGIIRLVVELPFVNWGYKFKPVFNYKTQEFALMLKRLPSALVSAGVTQINTLVDKAMASTLPIGTVSGLNYGQKLMNVFSGLLSSAIATALYPQVVELIALDKKNELSQLMTKIVDIFCVLMVPVTIACILFRIEIVELVFQRGAFDANSTVLTSGVFALYCLGLFFIACNTIIDNIFYGYGDTRTPMLINVVNLVVNVGLNITLIHFIGANGLALATSLSAGITFFIRFHSLGNYITLGKKRILVTALKVLVAANIACFIPRSIFWFYQSNNIITLIVSGFLGVLIYLLATKLLKIEEVEDIMAMIRR